MSNYPRTSGKVREIFVLPDDTLLFVATDRISAYDWILPTPIPDKGRVLSGLSDHWFDHLGIAHHRITSRIDDIADRIPALQRDADARASLEGRAMLVRKLHIVPFECVVRGYLSGSGWREYKAGGNVCGVDLPQRLVESDRLPEPIFTPATKAASGHDENVPFERMAADLGQDLAGRLRKASLAIYEKAAAMALKQGLILADTKFEWGLDVSGDIVLADEVLTPDSSRYWDAAAYRPGGPQPSYDKQFVRDWLDASGWDHASHPPSLPAEIVQRTRQKYVDAYRLITGREFPWGDAKHTHPA
ncbi:phosphoribosylaminoimidazolesuccinocarboxamide synthase [bacterium]|nr:phosphoribosylaminoimidazolesuccinocarboxamide synthase [bacterium]